MCDHFRIQDVEICTGIEEQIERTFAVDSCFKDTLLAQGNGGLARRTEVKVTGRSLAYRKRRREQHENGADHETKNG